MHSKPKKPQHSPYQVPPIAYRSKQQQQTLLDDTPPILAEQIKFLQKVVGAFLFFSRMVNPTLTAALNAIASRQSYDTEAFMKATWQLLDYVATYPN